MKRKTREEKAITLIALIITIVVLLILAVVAINAVTGDGIIQHATNAKTEYEKAQDKEEEMLGYYTGILETGEIVPTIEQLEEKHQFLYYSSLFKAIEAANTSSINESTQDANKDNAIAGIYTQEDKVFVVLLKDSVEDKRISITTDVTINLGGNVLKVEDIVAIDTAIGNTNNITIDGRLYGSKIVGNRRTIQARTNTLNIKGGTYEAYSTEGDTMTITAVGGNITLENATISSVSTTSHRANGLDLSSSIATITNCKIFADGKDSQGIANFDNAIVTINSSYAYGTFSGIGTAKGTKTYVNGGSFEGSWHGGIYFAHSSTGEAYVNGAKLSCVPYKGQVYDANKVWSDTAGFYVGTNSDMKVFINGCTINGGENAFAIRSADGTSEQNNEVYISNSTIGDNDIRIDSDTMKLVIGKGCNFNADDTNRPTVVTTTNNIYVK